MITNIQELEEKARPGFFSGEDMKILVKEVSHLKPGDVYMEIGVDRGRFLSVARMATDISVIVCGVDIAEDPKVPDTLFIHSDSVEAAKTVSKRINVLLIDGDHTYMGCKQDIQAWLPHMKEGGVILFHDFDVTSPGVMWAVSEFVDLNRKLVKEFVVFSKLDSNTSLAKIKL